MIDPFDDKSVPYIEGNTKTFWTFTSTSSNIKTSYKFLGKEENIKKGNIFTLYGDIWGYDISLFNVFGEKEILLEPEKKFIIDQVFPPVNEIIHVRCNMQESKLVLNFEKEKDVVIGFVENVDPVIDQYVKELLIDEKILDRKWNKNRNLNQNKRKKGEVNYIPPSNEWIGIGLKVNNKYDRQNNNWLWDNNKNGEYAVAYIGMNDYGNKNLTQIIEDLNFEINTIFNNEKNIRSIGFINALFGNNCGNGVLLFQNPKIAENYASIRKINNEQIKILIMCRVYSKKIRQPEIFKDCWILNPTTEEIRPYRILIKAIPPYKDENNYINVAKFPVDYIISAIKSNDFSF